MERNYRYCTRYSLPPLRGAANQVVEKKDAVLVAVTALHNQSCHDYEQPTDKEMASLMLLWDQSRTPHGPDKVARLAHRRAPACRNRLAKPVKLHLHVRLRQNLGDAVGRVRFPKTSYFHQHNSVCMVEKIRHDDSARFHGSGTVNASIPLRDPNSPLLVVQNLHAQ